MTDRNIHSQRTSAARAGFSERTARRFDADSTLPSQRKPKRARTVTDPLDGVWETLLLPILKQDSSVQAITLLRHLQPETISALQKLVAAGTSVSQAAKHLGIGRSTAYKAVTDTKQK